MLRQAGNRGVEEKVNDVGLERSSRSQIFQITGERMNRSKLDYLHKLALDYGLWAIGGRDRAGIAAVWPDIPHRSLVEGERQPRRATNGQKRLYPLPQPHSSRERPQARPLTGRIETQYTEIHGIAVRQPDQVKNMIVCLYFRGMGFRDIAVVTGMETKRISKLKYKFLDAISGVA